MIATARLESTSSRSQAGALERGNLPPSDESELELTIVMPCLNEALTVGTCVAKMLRTMRELGIEGEVVIVDNGSTDRSVEIATTAGACCLPPAQGVRQRPPPRLPRSSRPIHRHGRCR